MFADVTPLPWSLRGNEDRSSLLDPGFDGTFRWSSMMNGAGPIKTTHPAAHCDSVGKGGRHYCRNL